MQTNHLKPKRQPFLFTSGYKYEQHTHSSLSLTILLIALYRIEESCDKIHRRRLPSSLSFRK
jgi:hypothetical protein